MTATVGQATDYYMLSTFWEGILSKTLALEFLFFKRIIYFTLSLNVNGPEFL
jgi:hypothetical protein